MTVSSGAAAVRVAAVSSEWRPTRSAAMKCGLALLGLLWFGSALAQGGKQPWEEYEKLIQSKSVVGALGPDLFGDEVNFYNGSLSFAATDIDVPGNSRLPVALKRNLIVVNRREYPANDMSFADWDLDVPRLSGVFAPDWRDQRCSHTGAPNTAFSSSTAYPSSEFWQGNHAHMPGGGEMLVANKGATQPSAGGPYLWLTSGFTYFSCLSTIKNGSGEGFLAVTSDGTKYWFDWMARYGEPSLAGPMTATPDPHALTRKRNVLYATRVEDRFGNWVTYTYTNAATAPARLTTIQASDGRQIALTYNPQGYVATASNGLQSWTYQYTGTNLVAVVLPDASRWTIDFQPLSGAQIDYDGDQPRNCGTIVGILGGGGIGRMIHPSGAVGEFEVAPIRHGRSNVPQFCVNWEYPVNNPYNDLPVVPRDYDLLALVRKRISGPGLTLSEWAYSYSASRSWAAGVGPKCETEDCMEPVCVSDDCAGATATTIAGPGGEWQRYTFGNSYRYNEGKLTKVERGGSAANILYTETTQYDLAQSGRPFPTPIGTSLQQRSDGFTSEYLRPQIGKTIQQDGATFSSVVNAMDAFARPLSVTRASSLGHTRTDVTAYHDNLAKWVLGQTLSVTNTNTTPNVVLSRAEYDATTALPLRYYGPGTTSASGKLVQTLAYNADGTVASLKDGNNNITTVSNWKRGIPQTIQYPATPESPTGAAQSAVVNDAGWITSVTDENGYATGYTYDAMGRLASIVYPANDTVTWNTETFTFTPISTDEHGLGPGHWTMRRRLGNRHVNTYYDAFWRPVLEEQLDYANIGGTLSQVVKRYDARGRLAFQSYPQRGVGNYGDVTQGTRTLYDPLGRVTSVSQDSEHGPLTTLTAYLSGLRTQVTNPRNQQTITSFMAYDQPGYDWPKAIAHPEGAYTDITRDVFGKPTALKRRNGTDSVAVTRSYVYDIHQQLCKTVEPETGATIMDYDGAGNLQWSASGLALLSTTSCDTLAGRDSGRKVTRLYDARNRVATLSFPDGKGDQAWTYTPDGLPAGITTYNANGGDAATNSYVYNKRRLPVSETVGVAGQQWTTGYGYDANGSLASHVYPEGMTVGYAPNALGQPTQAGSYAAAVSYFPNGAIQQFTYGNGIVHTLTQNARQLPERSHDAYGATAFHDDSLDFDFNGNVAAITDGLAGARGNRDMSYDGLDRLTGVVSPMFGTASYSYDVLDNLKTVKLTAGPKVRDHVYVYDTANRLTNVMTSGSATVVGLGYDVQGNLANKNGVLHNFDYGNRLRDVPGVEQYRYDGHGRRVQALRNGASIYSVYGQDGVLRFQRDERLGKRTAYVYLAGSLVAEVEDPIALATPLLTAPGYSSSGSYTVSWTSATIATKYQLQEQVNGGSWTTIHDAAGTSKAMSGKPAGSYGYQVRACSATACGGWSAVATTTVQLPPTGVPSLSVPATGLNGSYPVSWSAVAAADKYQLQERLEAGAWSTIHDAAGTSKAISGKATGSWSYQVRACNAAGCGAYSAIATVQVVHPPASAPALTVPATNYTGGYTASWTAVGTATSYQLEERLGSGAWSQVHNAAATSKAISGKTAGSWGYQVRACNAAGCGAYSAVGTVAVTLPPAGVPALTVPASSYTGAYTVSWTAVSAATAYQLEEQVNGGSWTQIQNTGATSRAVSGQAAATYGYRVRACNVGGCGGYSTVGSVAVTLPPASAPALTVPASNTTGSYSVSWSAVGAATAYELEEQVNGGGWTLIQNTGATSRSIAKGAGNYGYRVRACNVAGCSGYSAVGTVSVSLPLTAPTIGGPTSTTSDFTYTLTWTVIAGATSYELQQSVNGAGWSTIQNTAATSITLQKRGGTFRYQVRACSSGGCSPYSAIHTVVVTQSTNRVGPEEAL